MRKDIDAIFTDFGGVLLPLHFERSFKMFQDLGADIPQEILFRDARFNTIMRQLELGLIENREFYAHLRELLCIASTDAEIEAAWNSIIGTVPLYKMQLLRELKQHYRVYMVSNTNAPHFDYTRKSLFRDEGLSVDDYFDKLYLSHEIHAQKPCAEFYQKVLADSGESARRCIFLDDLPDNIEGAKNAGFEAHLINSAEDLRKKISEILL